MKTITKRKLSNLYVNTIEQEVLLIRESEEKWWETNAKKAYIKGLDYINNLK